MVRKTVRVVTERDKLLYEEQIIKNVFRGNRTEYEQAMEMIRVGTQQNVVEHYTKIAKDKLDG